MKALLTLLLILGIQADESEIESPIKHPKASSSKGPDYSPANILHQSNGWCSGPKVEGTPDWLSVELQTAQFLHRMEVVWVSAA